MRNAPPTARGSGQEAWLLCPGEDERLAPCLTAFAEHLPARVLAHADAASQRWAAAFAHAAALAPEALGTPQAEGLLLRLEESFARDARRHFLFLPAPLLTATVARALGLAAPGARALRADPGRAYLLRDERVGLVLRHANVLGPEREPGTRLPLWKSAP